MNLNDILRAISENLLYPAMAVLVLLVVFMAVCIGSLVVETLTERRRFKANVARDVNAINDADYDEVSRVVDGTSLLREQKVALQMVVHNMGLPDEDLFSLSKAELAGLNANRQRIVRRTDLVTKIGPMMGLICTLIPLGPGIVAMGQGYVDQLSSSMLVAFDGTVTGLVVAVVAMVISFVRKRWYGQYAVCTESLMNALLEKAEQARKEGLNLECGYYRDSKNHAVTSSGK